MYSTFFKFLVVLKKAVPISYRLPRYSEPFLRHPALLRYHFQAREDTYLVSTMLGQTRLTNHTWMSWKQGIYD